MEFRFSKSAPEFSSIMNDTELWPNGIETVKASFQKSPHDEDRLEKVLETMKVVSKVEKAKKLLRRASEASISRDKNNLYDCARGLLKSVGNLDLIVACDDSLGDLYYRVQNELDFSNNQVNVSNNQTVSKFLSSSRDAQAKAQQFMETIGSPQTVSKFLSSSADAQVRVQKFVDTICVPSQKKSVQPPPPPRVRTKADRKRPHSKYCSASLSSPVHNKALQPKPSPTTVRYNQKNNDPKQCRSKHTPTTVSSPVQAKFVQPPPPPPMVQTTNDLKRQRSADTAMQSSDSVLESIPGLDPQLPRPTKRCKTQQSSETPSKKVSLDVPKDANVISSPNYGKIGLIRKNPERMVSAGSYCKVLEDKTIVEKKLSAISKNNVDLKDRLRFRDQFNSSEYNDLLHVHDDLISHYKKMEAENHARRSKYASMKDENARLRQKEAFLVLTEEDGYFGEDKDLKKLSKENEKLTMAISQLRRCSSWWLQQK